MYFDLSHLLLLAVLSIAAIYWWEAYGIKQLALIATKAYCLKMGVQLLDESMALKAIRFKRDASGKLTLQRRFNFEFASTGDERYQGETQMLGRQCEGIQLEAHRI